MLLNPTYRYLIKKGRDEIKLDIVKAMLSKGYSVEEIMDITKVSEEYVLSLE